MISKEDEKILKKYYYSPRTGLSSIKTLYYVAKPDLPNLRYKDVVEWVRSQETWQLHKETHEPRQVAAILPSGPHQIVQMDLIDLTPLKSPQNKQTTFILMAADTFSKMLYAVPIKDKTEESAVEAISDVIEKMKRRPKVIMSDNGLEFVNEGVKELLQELGIKQIFSKPGNPRTNGMVERANGTIKRQLFKYLTAYDTKKYIDALPEFVEQYNSTPHSVTKMPPLDIEELPPGSEELKRIRERMQKAAEKRGTPISGGGPEAGDEVRVALQKGALGKSYTQNYTDFTLPVERVIHGKKPYMPDRYRLGDGRTYYKEELLNIKDIQIPDKKEKERREPRVQRQAAPVEPKPRRERGRVERDVVEPEQTRGEGGRRYQGREKNVYGRPRYEEAIQALRGKRR